MIELFKIYKRLHNNYGHQGWWPLVSINGVNPTKTGSVKGYHPNDYTHPKNDEERFEICVGAILTQNTAWPNVEKSIINLKNINALTPKNLLKSDEEKLKEAIKPSGYFNQKTKKLKIFSEFYINLKGKTPSREELLNIWGVGPETADSILLYAYKKPSFVVDTYTKRIFSRIGVLKKDANYEEVKELFEKTLEKDYKIYQEYHALIVEHAKRYCQSKPNCKECILKDGCKKLF